MRAHKIFAQGSKNFHTSSIFFGAGDRQRVAVLYAFVRVVDDFVDAAPPQIATLRTFETQYRAICAGKSHPKDEYTAIISAFVELQHRFALEQKWIDAFFYSMNLDLSKREYHTLEETLKYMYGSAEIVGLCIVRILGGPAEADDYARTFGKALQYINFIRDIRDDIALNRRYLPLDNKLPDLSRATALQDTKRFVQYMRAHIRQFRKWLLEGQKGLCYIAPRMRVPIQTAADIFMAISHKIYRNPLIVYNRKVSLSKIRILFYAIKNIVIIALSAGSPKIAKSKNG